MGPRNCLCAQPSQNMLPCSVLEVQWSPQPESILIPCKRTRKSRKCPDGHAEPGGTARGPVISENRSYSVHTNAVEKTDTSLGSPRDPGGDSVPRQDERPGRW